MARLVWLVTGCSSGFGWAFVKQILHRGDLVIATARRVDSLQPLKDAGAAVLQLDVTSTQATLNAIITDAIAVYGHIDVLVNNAGYIAAGAWEDTPSVFRKFPLILILRSMLILSVTLKSVPISRQTYLVFSR
jgi:NAD(P)-dependent dehydrogenase (short-subunit alcohol dehydrogenase family)